MSGFWSHVDTSGGPDACWIWTGYCCADGYGVVRINDVAHLAHRVAFELSTGTSLGAKKIWRRRGCPRCCVNPGHFRHATPRPPKLGVHEARRASTSGVRGVYADGSTGRWRAKIDHRGQRFRLGRFATLEEAEAAVRAKREELLMTT